MSATIPLSGGRDAIEAHRRRATLVLIGLFWLFAFAMLSARAALVGDPAFLAMTPRRLLVAGLGALLCLAMTRIFARLGNRAFAERIRWGVAGALAMSVLITLFGMMLSRLALPVPGVAPLGLAETVQWIMVWTGYFLAWTGTHLALIYHWEAQDQQRRVSQMRDLAQEARIAALRYQVNPHFLFNTLNAISSLVLEQRNADAEAMLLNLSGFIRSALSTDRDGTIRLADEIELQRLYLSIEEARFADRMRVTFEIPYALDEAMVPPLILQPLVENAVRHGVDHSEQMTTIGITAIRRGERLQLIVEDDGRGLSTVQSGTGLGLRNVRERLKAHFGDRGILKAAPVRPFGYRAYVELPFVMRP